MAVCYSSRKRNAWLQEVFHLIHQKLTKRSKQKQTLLNLHNSDFLVFSINATAKFAKKQTGNVSFRYLQNLKMVDVQTTWRINWIAVT